MLVTDSKVKKDSPVLTNRILRSDTKPRYVRAFNLASVVQVNMIDFAKTEASVVIKETLFSCQVVSMDTYQNAMLTGKLCTEHYFVVAGMKGQLLFC